MFVLIINEISLFPIFAFFLAVYVSEKVVSRYTSCNIISAYDTEHAQDDNPNSHLLLIIS